MKTFTVALLCSLLMSMPLQAQTLTYLGTAPVAIPGEVPPNYGTTPAEVGTLFESTILANFENSPNLDAMVSGMDDMMLARLSTELVAHQHPSAYGDYTTYVLVDIMMNRLSAANLHRMAAVFGPNYFWGMQWLYPARPDMVAAYNALPAPVPYPLGQWWVSQGNALPIFGDLYLYDLFLDYYTASAGGDPAVAAQQMARYVRRKINGGLYDFVVGGAAILGLYFAMEANPDWQTAAAQLEADVKLCYESIGDCAVDGADFIFFGTLDSLASLLYPLVNPPPDVPTETYWPAPLSGDPTDWTTEYSYYYQGN